MKMTCKEIEQLQETGLSIQNAVKHPAFSHARRSKYFQGKSTYIYFFCSDSPSGVLLAKGGETNEVENALRQARNTSPLSPTEGR